MKIRSLLSAALLCAAPVFADNIALPANTGVGYNGAPAAAGSVDLNYTSVQGSPIYVESTFWVPGVTNAAWIGPDPTDGAYFNNGQYTLNYSVTFNATGFQANSIVLNGLLSADDDIENILVNGVSTNTWIGCAFGSLHGFTLNNGFIDGLNTIDFQFVNTGGEGGLLVDFTSATGTPDGNGYFGNAASPTATPEPGSLALFGLGVLGLGLLRKKAKKQRAN
jgi:hypothetical protein